MIALLFLFNIVFIYFFYFIGIWYLGIIPLLFVIFLIYISTEKEDLSGFNLGSIKFFILYNLFTFSWILINMGISLFLVNIKEIGVSLPLVNINTVFFFLMLFNIFLMIISYALSYKDGIKAFQSGMYINIILLLFFNIGKIGLDEYTHVILILIAFLLGVYSFINFVVITTKKYSSIVPYITFFYFVLTSIIGIYLYFKDNHYLTVFVGQIFLLLIFLYIYYIGKLKIKIINKEKKDEKKEDHQYQQLRDLLKKQDKPPANQINKFFKWFVFDADDYFKQIPTPIKMSLSLLNVILIFLQIYFLFINFQGGNSSIINEIFYWTSVCIFFLNFILLKSIDYYYYIQRAFVFFIINFGIYISLLDLFGTKDLLFISIVGICWNILNSVIILMSKKISLQKILYSEDYYRWIFANLSATLINLYFLMKIPASNFIKISIICVYIGMVLILLFYNIKYINELSIKK